MPTSQSEITRLRQKIEQECQALDRLMHGLASVANHHTITHKYHSLGQSMNDLSELVGVNAATEIAASIYIEILE